MVKVVGSSQDFKSIVSSAKGVGCVLPMMKALDRRFITVAEDTDLISDGGELWKVVVDFFATWCGPCRVIGPVLEKMSQKYTDATFLKVDVDELEDLAREYNISAMPTIIFLQEGKEVSKVVGANTQQIEATLQKLSSLAKA